MNVKEPVYLNLEDCDNIDKNYNVIYNNLRDEDLEKVLSNIIHTK